MIVLVIIVISSDILLEIAVSLKETHHSVHDLVIPEIGMYITLTFRKKTMTTMKTIQEMTMTTKETYTNTRAKLTQLPEVARDIFLIGLTLLTDDQ